MKYTEEWPTMALLILTYALFGFLTYATLPLGVTIPALAFVIALHSSLQHEVLHGHPTKYPWLNDLLVFPAIGLFVPYRRFKDTHLQHHFDPNLTDPYDDPETNYMDAALWARMPKPVRWLAQANNTLLGRMVFGPAISLAVFYACDIRRLLRGTLRVWRSYLEHVIGVGLVLIWLQAATSMPLGAYFCAAYLGLSLLKIRTFLEHRAHERAASRSVIIEDRGLFALLFLNNNYHSVHHAHPNVVWHRLPKLFREKRAYFLGRNDGYRYASYTEVFRSHLLWAKDPVEHPIWGTHNRTKPIDKG